MALTASVTRTLLALGALNLRTSSHMLDTPEEDAIEPVTWRREKVKSPYVDGEFLVTAVKETSGLSLRLIVQGTSLANLEANNKALVDAFSQFTYQVTIGAHTWKCEPADYMVGLKWQMHGFMVNPVTLLAPRHPVPVLGSF